MKVFDRFIVTVMFIMFLAVISINFIVFGMAANDNKLYKVEINRIEQEISDGNEVSSENYDTILGIYKYNKTDDFYTSQNEYVIREINSELYRIEYDDRFSSDNFKLPIAVNIASGIILLITLIVLLYIRYNIVKPFTEISDLPYQLSKGKLSAPLKETKKRYFGKFIWGLDMLRDELEKSKLRELERAKKEKTFLMSLSHDIKTPLSAIKLYSKAISKGIYSSRQKQTEAAEKIDLKADEIEAFINEIIKNLSSDFMTFEVNPTEFYLSQVIDKVSAYYADKLNSLGIDFKISRYVNCLISGDPDKIEEVLQNIIENAVKYGDGHCISINFSDEEDCRLITISNSGCTLLGIELTHIFDSFWRGSNTGSQQGCGLGLYICRQLMNAMGGDVFAEILNENMNVTIVCRKDV